MTWPRLVFAAASRYAGLTGEGHGVYPALRALSAVSSSTAVPVGAILYTAVMSCAALVFFGSFSRIVNFMVVPLQAANILMVAAVFPLRRRVAAEESVYRTPGYPIVPLVYIVVMTLFLLSAITYRPTDTFIGIALTSTGVPVFRWVGRKELA
jgi:APA family basic amino acid/polyamine antiporter